MDNHYDIEKELIYLGLHEKAREIYSELGETAALSYVRSSYRLLSKVYHPDLNPKNKEKAKIAQQRLNRFSHLLSRMSDKELIKLIKKGLNKEGKRKNKILIVEDELGLQKLLGDILWSEGYDVRVAEDGNSGYETGCLFRPDLVLTDILMPGMSGLELVRKMRKRTPWIKVIFISGFFGVKNLKQELDEEILRWGYGALSKPFKTSELLDLIGTYVHGLQIIQGRVNVYT